MAPFLVRRISPTAWQRQSYPTIFHDKIEVVHDGIDTLVVKPDEAAVFILPNGRRLTRKDEVVTFVNRNLEPCRGLVSLMRALPEVLRTRPDAHILIVGGDDISYGKRLTGQNWREAMLNEVGSQLDLSRVHFLGKIPYSQFLAMLQISTVHCYLTYPFVLSWSMLEAMAAGCVVVGSRTAPVEDIILHQENGYLVDFFSIGTLAKTIYNIYADPASHASIRQAARQIILDRYDLHRHCLPRQLAVLEQHFS